MKVYKGYYIIKTEKRIKENYPKHIHTCVCVCTCAKGYIYIYNSGQDLCTKVTTKFAHNHSIKGD